MDEQVWAAGFLLRPGPLVPGLLTLVGALLFGETCAAWQSLWSVLHKNIHDSQTMLSARL